MSTTRTPQRLGVVVVAALAFAACGTDGESQPVGSPVIDDDSTAVIVTTLPPTTEVPTAEPADTEPEATEPTEPPTTEAEPEATEPGTAETAPPTTEPPPATAAPTTTEAPTVGDPVVTVAEVGNFDEPVDLAVRPGDDALFIVEQSGRVVRVDGADSNVVADIRERAADSGGEQGLLGLVFSPAGDLAYFNYTDNGGTTIVAEYPVAADGTIDVDSEREVIAIPQSFSNHNAGDLAFGPDGLLYIPLGDGGSADDPNRVAHDPTSLLGSMLRIDPAPSGDLGYTIPADNPFASGTFEGREGRPEVWSWGLRNPWKIAFDPVTGDLWIPDVGQNQVEEVNLVSPSGGTPAGRGADFGWSAFEGTDRFNTDVADTGSMLPPVLTYQHGSDGCSVSGGAPYRGSAIAGLEPAFVYSDFCSGIIWALDLAGGRNLTLLTGFNSVSAVRAGPDGELYILQLSGTVYRLVPG